MVVASALRQSLRAKKIEIRFNDEVSRHLFVVTTDGVGQTRPEGVGLHKLLYSCDLEFGVCSRIIVAEHRKTNDGGPQIPQDKVCIMFCSAEGIEG